jgi:hypothetical protein
MRERNLSEPRYDVGDLETGDIAANALTSAAPLEDSCPTGG